MKYQSLISVKKKRKKNIINLPSAETAKTVGTVKRTMHQPARLRTYLV